MADKLVTQVSEEDAKKQKQQQRQQQKQKPRQEKSCWDLCCGCFSKKQQASPSAGPTPPRGGAPESDYRGLLPPLTQEQKDNNIHTLVLDLDETLVHSSFQYVSGVDLNITITLDGENYEVYVAKRPGVDQFLEHVAKEWEVIIFTASLDLYANPVLNRLDRKKVIVHRLFRDSCTLHYGQFVKDLTRLGRKLEHTLIVDNSPIAYTFQPENAIPISSWFSDKSDTELTNLCPLLDVLVKADDVSKELAKHKPLDLTRPFQQR